jgi:hypothetical protein
MCPNVHSSLHHQQGSPLQVRALEGVQHAAVRACKWLTASQSWHEAAAIGNSIRRLPAATSPAHSISLQLSKRRQDTCGGFEQE